VTRIRRVRGSPGLFKPEFLLRRCCFCRRRQWRRSLSARRFQCTIAPLVLKRHISIRCWNCLRS